MFESLFNLYDRIWLCRHKGNPSDIELISIHIPKTAGTSFRNILKAVYSNKQVVRIDISLLSEKTSFPSTSHPPPKHLPRGSRVIHGHFRYRDLAEFYKLNSDIPIITWVRDPVERVVSNYYYLRQVLEDILRKENRNINILNRMGKTLMEYARTDSCRNRMARFLEGLDLQDLYFIGIQEYFEEDLSDLAVMMKWTNYALYTHNKTNKHAQEIDEKTKEEIKEINQMDVQIYEQAMELRNIRRKLQKP